MFSHVTIGPRPDTAMAQQPPTIVVIDDDPSIRKALDNLFHSVGLDVELFGSPQEFLQSKRPDRPGCIVLDVRFPGRSGLDMQREMAAANTALPIIFITGYGDIPMSVRAMKAGAVEFPTRICSTRSAWPWSGTASAAPRRSGWPNCAPASTR
jgi:FixJ family two-component response regulator